MKDKLIEFKTAKLAKEKGFNWECRFLYQSELGWEEGKGVDYNWNSFDSFSAPTQSLLQRWLREVHQIMIIIDSCGDNKTCSWEFYYNNGEDFLKSEECDWYDDYETSLEKALQEALKLIK